MEAESRYSGTYGMGLFSRPPIRFSCLSQYETCDDAATQPRLQSPGLSLSLFRAFPKNGNIISSHSTHFLRWESPHRSSVTMKQAVWCGAQRKYLYLSRSSPSPCTLWPFNPLYNRIKIHRCFLRKKSSGSSNQNRRYTVYQVKKSCPG